VKYVRRFEEVDLGDLELVGGKNASLGEMTRNLSSAGVPVPPGFATTAEAFRLLVTRAGIESELYGALARARSGDVAALTRAGRAARALVLSAPLPDEVVKEVRSAYRELSQRCEVAEVDVAVRSSATAEDLPGASFAGQQESFLHIQGIDAVLTAVKECMASLFTDRAISYRNERGFDHRAVSISVGVQQMVRGDRAGAGVIFTLDPESGFRDVTLITATWGLGDAIVQGRVNPDEYLVHKPTLDLGFRSLLRKTCGEKAIRTVYAKSGVIDAPVSLEEQRRFVLSDDEVLQLARYATQIEKHYSARAEHPVPMDIEWAKDGDTGKLYILQARPETVHSQQEGFERFELRGSGRILLTGTSVGERIGTGKVHVVRSAAELSGFMKGDVLVAPMTDPDWEPVLARAAAIVTDQGGRTCHAAIVARELSVPCIVGTGTATQTLENDQEVTVSCAEGVKGTVFEGSIPFERIVLDPKSLPSPRVPVMLNVGSPEIAFRVAQLPSSGVGLARMEFIISSWIGVHPMALIHPERVPDEKSREQVLERARGYDPPSEFFVERLASGVAQIAAAFYPRTVILRFSDFKTNEYAGLLGGKAFEEPEDNPMIGFRGASRYYDDRYREGFALECAAVRRVRENMGLTNLAVMVPFCRTLEEGRLVLAEMQKNGLERGARGLEVYVMCEIPNNVILADEFSELFDGFSIGSNDLTQLTLGVDRDSKSLAHIFNERDPGVLRLISQVVERAHHHGRKVGFCGQAPSDHAEFAEFLAGLGIDSISVTPDALAKVLQKLAS
jgi:pyruvate,water dikinase